MDFNITESEEEGGFILTIENTKWIYPTLKKVFDKIERLLEAAKKEE